MSDEEIRKSASEPAPENVAPAEPEAPAKETAKGRTRKEPEAPAKETAAPKTVRSPVRPPKIIVR